MMTIIIYATGFVIAYPMFKKIFKQDLSLDEPYGWHEVLGCFLFSAFSWAGVLVALIVMLINYLGNKKPFKFL